jgi:DNA mismatch repair protein MSH6
VTPPSSSTKSKVGASTPSNGEPQSTGPDASGVYGAGCHIHDGLVWLNQKRRDINGNAPDSPDFDPRTLTVPAEFLKKETPAMAQWWQVKAHNMDTVLFFKVGKFYELFHMDADIGFKELNLIYMKGEKAHSGFPEIAYGKFSSQLIAKGYRVARVEQTETPDMMKERNMKTASKSKVVRREVCSVLSTGTNTMSFLDAPVSSASLERATSTHLMALKERLVAQDGSTTKVVRYGVCLVDCGTGAFHVAEFDDSEQRDRLKTLFAQFNVVEVVNERNGLCADTKQVIKFAAAPSVMRSELIVGKEFWDANRTVEEIIRAGYFNASGWPEDVAGFLNMDKSVREDGQLAISALGGCIWHLRRSIIDQELVSLCNFKRYTPSDEQTSTVQQQESHSVEMDLSQQYVVLDSQTIQNLEILTNNHNGSRKGSLIDIMDKTVTAFGKRMFQEWVLKPLCKIDEINERLDAVEELGQNFELMDEVRGFLHKMPDLERLLSRIHALGSTHRSQDHPDSRAIMYESNVYNIRKIRDFIQVLDGFDRAMDLLDQLGPRFSQLRSPLLRTVLKKYDVTEQNASLRGHFPELHEKLQFFRRSFDQAKAAKSGVIVPQEGADPDYDDACESIVKVQEELEEYLQEQRKRLKAKQINYWGTKKDERYQLEVPESSVQGSQPKEYELKSRKKGFKRFHTPTIRELLAKLIAAEERKELALKDQTRRIFHKFDEDYKYWIKAVQCLAVLDCLVGLALVSSQSEGFVRPQVVSAAAENGGAPFIDIEEGVHPCVASTFDSGEFIPNDTQLGVGGNSQMLLLSGPNMGGKSTLLRQTCVLALMAQVGCFVPAAKCRMSPVDRIFTRIGASDRILAGQSTLYVELSETATILNHASKHSLVILDELGRGTSTFDGTAIAYAVVEFLLRKVACRSLFATHYHSLVEEYLHDSKVALGHMGCLVDPENERKVTFLYKLEEGMCPKSYGINVAMLAKLPDEVIDMAAKKSEQFEQSLQAHSHSEEEALTLANRIQQCLSSENVDVSELQTLWADAQRLIDA